jgi:hypothetical protein
MRGKQITSAVRMEFGHSKNNRICSFEITKTTSKFFAFLTYALLAVTFLASSLHAEFGSTGWSIFKRLQSSQFNAISQVSPVNADLSGVMYNPSILGVINRKEILFVSELGLAEDKFGAVLIGIPWGEGMCSVGAMYYDAGLAEFNWVDNGTLQSREAYAERDTLAAFSYEHPLSRKVFAGVTVKGATSELAEYKSASAAAADVGILYLPKPYLSFALALQNAGRSTAFIDKPDKLPETVYGGSGLAFRMGGLKIVSCVGAEYNIAEEQITSEAGAEFGNDMISLNAGYKFWENESNVHIGFRVMLAHAVFGYAYLPGARLDPVQRLTISLRFKS